MPSPIHGWTRLGHPVHHRTQDHLPSASRYARLNKHVAIAITTAVGTMSCAWIFTLLALSSLPAVLVAANIVHFHNVFSSTGFILCVSWIAQTFIQLVLLSIILVGQNLSSAASDVRAAKQFEDTEIILDRWDEKTEGGMKLLMDRLNAIEARLDRT